jgi:glycosyltransferase involved in cell wall biosynthesis
MESLFLKTFDIDSNKVFHLYKGLDLDEIAIHSKRKERLFSEGCIKILFVKSDFIRGGLPLLLEAINVLQKTMNIELSVVGPRDDSCLGRFKGSNFVKFLGKCDQNEVFKLMAESAIFCVPSYKEALGVANLEAMALGCLVVSTNTGGIPEVLDYGNAGRLIEPGNLEQLIKALEDSCQDSLTNHKLLRNAQTTINRFNVNTAISKLLALAQENECE